MNQQRAGVLACPLLFSLRIAAALLSAQRDLQWNRPGG
jgi:hypothetical protein